MASSRDEMKRKKNINDEILVVVVVVAGEEQQQIQLCANPLLIMIMGCILKYYYDMTMYQ